VLLLVPKMAGSATVAAAKEGLLLSKMVLLLKISGKGAVADAKNAMLLLKRLLLQLPKMAGCGTVEAT